MPDLDGMEEQLLLKRVTLTATTPITAVYEKSCPTSGGKHCARGGRTWTVGMITRMMEDRLDERIRLNSLRFYSTHIHA